MGPAKNRMKPRIQGARKSSPQVLSLFANELPTDGRITASVLAVYGIPGFADTEDVIATTNPY
jgi:hypothetical protein